MVQRYNPRNAGLVSTFKLKILVQAKIWGFPKKWCYQYPTTIGLILRMSILGCEMGVPPSKETPIWFPNLVYRIKEDKQLLRGIPDCTHQMKKKRSNHVVSFKSCSFSGVFVIFPFTHSFQFDIFHLHHTHFKNQTKHTPPK